MNVLARIIDITTIILTGLIAIRTILKLLGANTVAPFVSWVYSLTNDLLVPFEGIFPIPTVGTTGLFDIPALFGLIIYMAVGYFLSQLIRLAQRELKTPKIFQSKSQE